MSHAHANLALTKGIPNNGLSNRCKAECDRVKDREMAVCELTLDHDLVECDHPLLPQEYMLGDFGQENITVTNCYREAMDKFIACEADKLDKHKICLDNCPPGF
jgi:hypothetical protein